MNSRVGPRVIPYIVGAGLVVVGIWFVVESCAGAVPGRRRARTPRTSISPLPTDGRTVGFIGAALVVYLS